MSMLARYKKGGNIIELVKLVEDSGEPKRSQLLAMVRAEDPDYATQVEARIFDFAKLKALPENVVAEIIATASPKIIAMAIYGLDAQFITLCERCVGKNFGDYKAEKENFAATPPTPAQVESAQRKLVSEARKLEAAGAIKLMSPELEASLANIAQAKASSSPAAGATAGNSSSSLPNESKPAEAAAGPSTAHLDHGVCPSIESFNLQVPPPGLNGERFETFIKTNLGK